MQIRGLQPRGSYRSVCVLPRPNGESLALSMQPLPLGFQRLLGEHGIVPPSPPARIARDSAGRPLRDDSGAAVTITDGQDVDYRRALELYHQRVAVLAVVESLEGDPNVEFETQRPDGAGGWERYADAVYAEMELAGLTAGDLVHLCGFACRLSNLSGEHLREAGAKFFVGGCGDELTDPARAARAIDYFVLRTCERLGISEWEFWRMPYGMQVRYLAYERLRAEEETG